MERIVVSGKEAKKFVGPIEGLIFDPQPCQLAAPDPLRDRLMTRWRDIFKEYRSLRGDGAQQREQSLLIVHTSPLRSYQVGLSLENSALGYGVVRCSLDLLQLEEGPQEKLIMSEMGIRRVRGSNVDGELYIPRFAEQQRLLKVGELFGRYRHTISIITVLGD